MAAKGILPPTLKIVLKKYYPLPVLLHPKIPSRSSSLPYTEPESSGDNQTENDSLGAPADVWEEKRSETPLAVEPDDMTGKHQDQVKIPLERAQFLGGEGKMMPKRECPALKSPPAGTRLDKPGELHLVMQ